MERNRKRFGVAANENNKFKRDGQKTTDSRGRVVIRISLANAKEYTPLRNNLVQVMAVSDAKVSEVFAAIERALFGEDS